MATPKLKNPPIIEVVCEFRFNLENPNDATLPGRLYALVQKDFPTIKNKNLGSVLPIEGKTNETELLVTPLAQFYNKEENLLLQVGHNMLTINCVKKYPTWERFKPIILENHEKYCDTAKPKSIKKISLRSINKIHIGGEEISLKDYFVFYPASPQNIKEPLTSFNLHIETALQNKRDILVMKNTTVVPNKDKENHIAFVLDLSYIMNKPGEIKLEQVGDWLETAHDELYNAFTASITKNLLNDFNK